MGGPGLLLLPLLAGLGSAVSDLEPPRNIWIRNRNGNFSASWYWIDMSDDDMEVNFTVFYQESGMAAIEIPGCVHIDKYVCGIPSELLDFSKNYTLYVRVETSQGDKLSDPVNFQPNMTAWPPIPTLQLVLHDGLVRADISTPVHPVNAKYIVVLQNMNSNAKRTIRPIMTPFDILFNHLDDDDVKYCLRAQVFDGQIGKYSPFSAPSCFRTPEALPKNLRVEAINLVYILKWDWDYQQNPHVTFSVKKSYFSLSNWSTMEGCENITMLECNVSSIDILYDYKFLVLVYNNQTDEHKSSIVTFSPSKETTMGPPTNMKLITKSNDLHITVEAPEGLKDPVLRSRCTWMYHLEIWKNSTPEEVITIKEIGPHFMLKAVEASTTYCAKAYTKCKEQNRTGLYSERKCTDTDPLSYTKGWIIGAVFGGIIIISGILYICLCPFKRYLKYIFFPKSKLPSSIEKGFQESPRNYIRNFFLLHEEEPTDKCYTMQISPVDDEIIIDKNHSGAKGRDSGNYSNEDEVTGDSAATIQ